MEKFITVSEMRELEKQVSLGEISYSRMVEILNEKANIILLNADYVRYLQERLKNWHIAFNDFESWKKMQ